jgi:hypothetical protein
MGEDKNHHHWDGAYQEGNGCPNNIYPLSYINTY